MLLRVLAAVMNGGHFQPGSLQVQGIGRSRHIRNHGVKRYRHLAETAGEGHGANTLDQHPRRQAVS